MRQLDQTVSELQASEEKELKSQGVLGIFLWKQQQIIRDQQAQIEALQEQNQTLRNELTQLVRQEIKPIQEWRGKLFTSDREQMIVRLTDREKIELIKEQQEIKEKEEAKLRAEEGLSRRPTLLPLQNKLIAACKQGDLKEVQEAFRQGAKPYSLDEKQDEHPLGAAVWGMNPNVVNEVIRQADGIALMTWDECEKHNLKFYKGVFIVPKFDRQTYYSYGDEYGESQEPRNTNPFIRAYQMNINEENGGVAEPKVPGHREVISFNQFRSEHASRVRRKMEILRTQIKQSVETAKQSIKLVQEDLKYETPIQPPKPTLPLPPVSQIIQQTISTPPKPKATSEQLRLQDQLIAACKQGDLKGAQGAFRQGAKPYPLDEKKDEHPLGAATWGMNPDVVNEIIRQASGVAPMTWQECERHNLKYYKEVFIIPKFDPKTFEEWNALLKKMDPNPFICEFHLKKANEQWGASWTGAWRNYKDYMDYRSYTAYRSFSGGFEEKDKLARAETEAGYVNYRSQIKQGIESANQPTVRINF